MHNLTIAHPGAVLVGPPIEPRPHAPRLEAYLYPTLVVVGLVMTWITRDVGLSITSTAFAAGAFIAALICKHREAERLAAWNAREFAIADRQFTHLLALAGAVVDTPDRSRDERRAIWALTHQILAFRQFELTAAARQVEDVTT